MGEDSLRCTTDAVECSRGQCGSTVLGLTIHCTLCVHVAGRTWPSFALPPYSDWISLFIALCVGFPRLFDPWCPQGRDAASSSFAATSSTSTATRRRAWPLPQPSCVASLVNALAGIASRGPSKSAPSSASSSSRSCYSSSTCTVWAVPDSLTESARRFDFQAAGEQHAATITTRLWRTCQWLRTSPGTRLESSTIPPCST